MSGAEVVAAARGMADFAQLLKKADRIISWIRFGPCEQQLSADISEVELSFEFLVHWQKLNVNRELPQSNTLNKAIHKVSREINDLQDMIDFEKSLKDSTKRDRARHAFKQSARTKKLQDRLLSLEKSLRLVSNILLVRFLSQNSPAPESPPSRGLTPTEVVKDEALQVEIAKSSFRTPTSSSDMARIQPIFGYFPIGYRSRCSRGTCDCSCHNTALDTYHRNRVQGSPLSSLFKQCTCSAKYFSWTVTAFQRQVSLVVSLAYEKRFSLSPSLRICNTVPNTSPLFVVLYKCRLGYMEFDTALSKIHAIMVSGRGSPYDINRDGDNFFDVLLGYPWDFLYQDTQFALLDHFMSMGASVESETLLLRATEWIGEGPHMALLETILPRDGGPPLMDPTKAHTVLFQNWPSTFDSNWICRALTPDPFFIEALSLFVNHDPDFGDTGALQYQIHSGSLDSIRRLLSRRDSSHFTKEKNFLKQSALHISVNKPKVLKLLLSHGFAKIVDDGDRDGTTALMYAAAYGEATSAIELLRAGADPWLLSDKKDLYLNHALERGHFALIEDIVNFHNAEGDPATAQLSLDIALHHYVWGHINSVDLSREGLRRLLTLGAKPRWVSGKGNTLFHAISSADRASLLLEFCSPPPGSQNAMGYTPLMMQSWHLDADLVRKLLSAEVQVNTRDRSGWTVFEHLFGASSSRCSGAWCSGQCGLMEWVPTFQIVFDLLQAGADFGSSDCCTCPCSSQGCTALRFLLPNIYSRGNRGHNLLWIPCIVELFILLRSFHKEGLQSLIRSLVRRQRFDEIGLTHTCCLTLDDTFIRQYSSPYMRSVELERSEDCHGRTINADHNEHGELHEEQEELVEELEEYCQDFAKRNELAPTDCESTLITTLARRVVFIELGSTQAETNSRHRLIDQQSRLRVNKKGGNIEVLSSPPNEHVIDYDKDEFTGRYYCSFRGRDYSIPCIEDLMNDYLQATEKLDYHSLLLLDNYAGRGPHDERQRLCQMLVREIQATRNRKMSEGEADWTLDIVGGRI